MRPRALLAGPAALLALYAAGSCAGTPPEAGRTPPVEAVGPEPPSPTDRAPDPGQEPEEPADAGGEGPPAPRTPRSTWPCQPVWQTFRLGEKAVRVFGCAPGDAGPE